MTKEENTKTKNLFFEKQPFSQFSCLYFNLRKMKNILLLVLLVLVFNTTRAQVPSTCIIPPLLMNEYGRDIKQLAVQRLFELQSPDTALVRIPQEYTDTISEGMAAILNAISVPERDSVFNIYCVHQLNPFDGFGAYDGLLVKVDTNYAWTSAWQNLNTITGDPLIDTLVTRYSLTISNFYNWTIGNYAVLSTDSSWNIFALIDSIEMVPGVLTAEQNSLVGVAGKISYSKIGNSRFYDFYFEYQDCFDGCDAYRKWSFKVNTDCSVEYLGFVDWCFWGVGQCPLPAPINCNTFTSIKEDDFEKINCRFLPNPSSGKFQIEVIGVTFWSHFNLEVYNYRSELIYHSELKNSKSEIDLSDQTPGMYLVKIYNEQSLLTRKIVIQ